MEKKLYCVKVTLYVMAENASEACVVATQAPFDIFECTARKADQVEPAWESAVPYNAEDDRTCGQILLDEKALHPTTSFLTITRPRHSMPRAPLNSTVG